MQLPPKEAVVMVSGTPPIKALKLRYFEDQNFTERLGDPPSSVLLPKPRRDDWSGKKPVGHAASEIADDTNADEGGHEKKLAPDLNTHRSHRKGPDEPDVRIDVDDEVQEHSLESSKQALRAMGLDQADKDLLPDF